MACSHSRFFRRIGCSRPRHPPSVDLFYQVTKAQTSAVMISRTRRSLILFDCPNIGKCFPKVRQRFQNLKPSFQKVGERFPKVKKRFPLVDWSFYFQWKCFLFQDQRFSFQKKYFLSQDQRFSFQGKSWTNLGLRRTRLGFLIKTVGMAYAKSRSHELPVVLTTTARPGGSSQSEK